MGENFAFFLPIMMASFSVAFLIIWGWGARGAGYWSAAFFSVACGFAIPVAFAALPVRLWRLTRLSLHVLGGLWQVRKQVTAAQEILTLRGDGGEDLRPRQGSATGRAARHA